MMSFKVTVHTLRQSFANHLLKSGVYFLHIQELLGHKSSRTAEVYTHVSAKDISRIKSPLDSIDLAMEGKNEFPANFEFSEGKIYTNRVYIYSRSLSISELGTDMSKWFKIAGDTKYIVEVKHE